MAIHAAIFDMDGLLLDTERLLVRFWCEAANELGFPMQPHHALHLRSLSGPYAAVYLRRQFGESFDHKAVRDRRREKMNEYFLRHPIPVKPGAAELLGWLRGHGIHTAVATATDETRAARYLTETGLLPLFDEICCAPNVPRGKPMPDVYLSACRKIGQPPSSCLALEDSPNGVLSAWRAGCRVILVPDQTAPDPQLLPLLWGTAGSLMGVRDLLIERGL